MQILIFLLTFPHTELGAPVSAVAENGLQETFFSLRFSDFFQLLILFTVTVTKNDNNKTFYLKVATLQTNLLPLHTC